MLRENRGPSQSNRPRYVYLDKFIRFKSKVSEEISNNAEEVDALKKSVKILAIGFTVAIVIGLILSVVALIN